MRTFRSWADFGPDGITPRALELEYDQNAEYSFPSNVEQVVDELWNKATAENDVLHDGDSLNTLSVSSDDSRIRLGPASFRHHYARLLHLHGEVSLTEYGMSPNEVEALVRDVRILSSFTVVRTDSELVLGLRGGERSHLTYPGSGYLDAQLDVTEEGELRSPRELLLRELGEELGLIERVTDVSVLGVFEDAYLGTDHNPSVFSIVHVDATPEVVTSSWKNATDAWEFEELLFLPAKRKSLTNFLRRAISDRDSIDVPGIAFPREATVHGKSFLASLLVGRAEFGVDWYREQRESFSDSITLDEITSSPDI